MNPYQIIGLIVICTLSFAAIVAGLVLLGVPLLLAFVGVYLVAIWFMLSMQRRAQQFADMQAMRRSNRYAPDTYGDSVRRSANQSASKSAIKSAKQGNVFSNGRTPELVSPKLKRFRVV